MNAPDSLPTKAKELRALLLAERAVHAQERARHAEELRTERKAKERGFRHFGPVNICAPHGKLLPAALSIAQGMAAFFPFPRPRCCLRFGLHGTSQPTSNRRLRTSWLSNAWS